MCLEVLLRTINLKSCKKLSLTHLFFSSSLCVDLQKQKTEAVKQSQCKIQAQHYIRKILVISTEHVYYTLKHGFRGTW